MLKRIVARISQVDKVLAVALLLSLAFLVYGIHWGRVQPWNPDQMAYVRVFYPGELPLNPKMFLRPPFHIYLNYLLVHIPVFVVGTLCDWSSMAVRSVNLIASKMLTVGLFLGAVCLAFSISRKAFGLFPARAVALIFSTSAGFIALGHFLTVDVPVTFWMLLSFYFAQKILFDGTTRDYALAGFFAGISAATKYNGVIVGCAIVAAHLLSLDSTCWKEVRSHKKLLLGLVMILVGFLLGDPFAALDYRTFLRDFMYLYYTTPVYWGDAGGHNYIGFFLRIVDLIGLPAFVISFVALLFCIVYLFGSEEATRKKTLVLAISVLVPTYLILSSYPRLLARFIAPIVPFWLILSGPLWNRLRAQRLLVPVLLAVILAYNLVSGFYVGKRFIEDPRMDAQEWAIHNISPGSSVEYTPYSPRWDLIMEEVEATETQSFSGRKRIFAEIFGDNPWVQAKLENEGEGDLWFSEEQLLARNPDYVAVDSLFYSRFTEEGSLSGEYYPAWTLK